MRRIGFVVLALLIFPPLVYYALEFLRESTRLSPGQDLVQLNDYVKEALNFKREQVNSLAQLAILLVGALWALVIGAKAPRQPLNRLSWLVFSSANISLAASYVFYLRGIDSLIEYLFKAQTIDLYSPKLSLYSDYQTMTFSLGLAYSFVFALLFYRRPMETRT